MGEKHKRDCLFKDNPFYAFFGHSVCYAYAFEAVHFGLEDMIL